MLTKCTRQGRRRFLARPVLLAWVLVVVALGAGRADAENWPQFRGNSSGVVAAGRLPTQWGPDQHIVWKSVLPGAGWSQPVVWGDKVFVTTAEADGQPRPDPKNWGPGPEGPSLLSFFARRPTAGLQPPDVTYRWKVLCLACSTGDLLWERVARQGRPKIAIHPNNSYATETPVTDGERLIAGFGMTGVYCYDLSGELLWSKDLDPYSIQFGWGTGSSLALLGDHVFLQCDNEQASFLAALDKRNGAQVWRVDRQEGSNWSTPFLWKNTLRTELVTCGGTKTRAYDPQTGSLLWEIEGSGRTATTPVGDEQLLYVDSYDRLTGHAGMLIAIRPGASGEISLDKPGAGQEHVAWSIRLTGYRSASPLLYQGCLYVLEQQSGIVRCLDAKTGKEHYRQRLSGASGFTASPLAAGGRVYFFDQNSVTIVAEAGPELRIVATNKLDGEMCWATPAVVGDRLLIRTVNGLYCIGQSQ
jgi:outer membrane protein assembly factor BamB